MKKFVCLFVILSVFGFLALIPAEVKAGWVLYDNFNSGIIDPNLWDIDNSSANISVVSGHLKFEHLPGYPKDSSKLIFKQNPEGIKAVRVSIMVQSCTGDVQGRIGGYIGEDQDGYLIFKRIAVVNERSRIDCWVGTETPPPVEPIYDLHYSAFKKPIEILGKVFTIAMDFNRQSLVSWAKGFGTNFYTPKQPILPTTQFLWKQIGTRSTNGDGPAVVWFDDVYVLY